MKKTILLSLVFTYLFLLSNGQINVPAGNVTGTWTTGNTYKVLGDITVAAGTTLSIQPGVIVKFAGPYRMTVSGKLNAIGKSGQVIQFTTFVTDTAGLYKKITPANGGVGRWNGIFFSFANAPGDTSKMDYCTVEYCNTYENQSNTYYEQSAVTCYYSTLIISNCLIKNNYGVNAGGIKTDYGYVQIINNTIRDNTGFGIAGGIYANTNQPKIIRGNTITNNKGIQGGGMQLSQCGLNVIVDGNFISGNYALAGGGIMASTLASGQILQNIIVNNTAGSGAGVYFSNAGMVFLNNTICNNLATNSGGGVSLSGLTYVDGENNIIWGNKVNATNNNIDISSSDCKPGFTSSLIGSGISTITGYPGNATLNNIKTVSPQFVNASAGVGKAFTSVPADWKLTVTSPCINAGTETKFSEKLPSLDFFKNSRVGFEVIDIGAHEFYQSSSSVTGTISTPTLWISDTIKVTGNLTVNANLTIAPGVLVQFQGYYDVTINDTLIAMGTAQNPIRFSIKDILPFPNKLNTNGRYKGFYTNGTAGIKFSYCIFNYAERLQFNNSPNFLFENNTIEKCLADYNFMVVSGAGASIKNNIFRNNDNIQGSYYRLIYLSSLNCQFEGNRIYNNNTSSIESYESNLRFDNNLIYNNNGGVLLLRSGYGNLFVNNTFAYNQSGIAVEQGTDKFFNNIIYKNGSPEFYSLSYVDQMFMSHNIFGSNITPAAWETFDGNIVADPIFIKPVSTPGKSAAADNANYSIFSISPAIDKGVNTIVGFTFPLIDITGNLRNNNGSIDIGAFEDSHKLPVISVQPVSGSYCEGQNLSINVTPFPVDTMLYQWLKNGENIPGEKSNTFTINNISPDDFGSYSCKLSNAYGFTESFPSSISIKSKPAILFTSDAQTLCQNQDLTLEVSAAGQLPLTYTWIKDAESLPDFLTNRLKITSAEVSDAGIYQSIVTNQCGSDTSEIISVNIDPLPVVNLGNDSVLCGNGNLVLDPGVFQSYQWNDFTSNRFKTVLTSGDYSVRVTDINGCVGYSNTVSMQVRLPYEDEKICMVMIDPETQKNMIIWEKTPDVGTQRYQVWRAAGAGYSLVSEVYDADASVVIDWNSKPKTKTDAYVLVAIDSCGNASQKSSWHKPFLLQSNKSILDNVINLNWEPYLVDGYEYIFKSIVIYRGTDSTRLEPIDTIAAGIGSVSYTDFNPPLNVNVYYRIGGEKDQPCDPNHILGKKTSSGPYVHSLSNLEDNRLQVTGINSLNEANKLSIYPNPMKTESRIEWENPDFSRFDLYIYDLKGTVVRTESGLTSQQYLLQRESLSPGCYVLELKGKNSYRGRLFVE